VAIALLMRTLSNFQGTILMAERGMVVEAGTLARCCFENAVFVGALRNEGDKFLAEVQMTDRYSAKTMARWLVQVPDRLQHAPQGAKRRLEGLINEIRQQIPTTAGGELLFHVMGALAQFERRLNAERRRAGIEAARRRGKHLGRPADLTPEKVDHARHMIETGEQSVSGMAKLLTVHRSTLHRGLKRQRLKA
jgi:transposase-like protein